jgi:hypothetical protein
MARTDRGRGRRTAQGLPRSQANRNHRHHRTVQRRGKAIDRPNNRFPSNGHGGDCCQALTPAIRIWACGGRLPALAFQTFALQICIGLSPWAGCTIHQPIEKPDIAQASAHRNQAHNGCWSHRAHSARRRGIPHHAVGAAACYSPAFRDAAFQ